jgi:hypothetical protein
MIAEPTVMATAIRGMYWAGVVPIRPATTQQKS